jgi:mannose-6-phosphate isomerase-like protein (cupin superfamily)
MMEVTDIQAKGLTKLLSVPGIVPDKLRMHISKVDAGSRSHAAHTHSGIEAFYIFEGNVTVEIEGQHFPLGPNEAMVLDATKPHGIFNSGNTKTKYLVVIAP